jgi:sortase A
MAKLLLAGFFILIGLFIILRPFYLAWRFDRIQNNMLNKWQSTSEFHEDSVRIGWQHSVAVVGGADTNEVWEENIYPKIDAKYFLQNMDGILSIDKIHLTAPIISKYTVDNLSVSICSVIEANKMGKAGNYVIAGHKSRIRGRHFSRLVELKTGDLIVTANKNAKYTYQVTDIFTVTPVDTWVMDNDGDKELITLITCDYRTDPIGRLIVRGELIGTEPLEGTF